MPESQEIKAQRRKVRDLRERYLWHVARGQAAPALKRAYLRAKSVLARMIRDSREHEGRTIHSRREGGLAAPTGTMGRNGQLKSIGVHHAAALWSTFLPLAERATLGQEAAFMREMQRWHFGRAFSDLGYAFVVYPSGRIWEGRNDKVIGAHVLNHNEKTIGICAVGNFESDRPTQAQLDGLRWLIAELRAGRLGPGAEGGVVVKGHREYSGHETNACPGKHLFQHIKNW